MKKIFLLVSLLLMMFFVGCAASPMESQIYIDEDISFSYVEGEFLDISDKDIINGILDHDKDRVIMLEYAVEKGKIESVSSNVIHLLDIISAIEFESEYSFKYITEQSSSSFNDLAENYYDSLDKLSIDDIIAFNDLKQLLLELNTIRINKINYLEYRLNKEMTQSEIIDLDILQDYYLVLINNYYSYDLSNVDSSQFISDLMDMGYLISEEKKASIENAFAIYYFLK